MQKEQMENIVQFFTDVQTCKDKRMAFIKGVLFGIGFSPIKEPCWKIIEKNYKKDESSIDWIKFEKEIYQIERKIRQDQIELLTSMLT